MDGHDAAPHANLFPERDPRTSKLALDTDERVPGHTHPDHRIVFVLRDGAIELRLGDDTYDQTAGDVVLFDGGQTIELHASEPTTALFVLATKH